MNECFTMADKYNFDFGSEDDDEKAIFLSAIQFADMLFFESNYMGSGSIWENIDHSLIHFLAWGFKTSSQLLTLIVKL